MPWMAVFLFVLIGRSVNALQLEYLKDAALMISKARNIIITGSGTSYHAALIGRHYLRALADAKADVIPAGEFLYEGLDMVEPGTLIIAISQSGESADIIRAVRMAKRRGAAILGIINRLGSTLMRESNVYLPVSTGPEMAVPATKTFTATLSVLLQLSAVIPNRLSEFQAKILEVSKLLTSRVDSIRDNVKNIAEEIKDSGNAYVISGGPLGYPLALETALKLKEAAHMHAEAYNFREFKHGPMTLITSKFPVIAIMPCGEMNNDMEPVIVESWHRGATTIIISSKYRHKIGDFMISLNGDFDELIMPIIYAPIIQLLAYELGVAKGIDVDNPPHITKVVTT
ncbi:SIS domain-containing protein [Vulcanisaeta moutnovskia]|uniref:SIS domain-containing protein n=1 Tax=Vulcanisaeta moutnovskia TaxID=985052 RepID=UPI000A02F057|nr:SIS domain-containing protein [Vulcanisaeta moutnovskia]